MSAPVKRYVVVEISGEPGRIGPYTEIVRLGLSLTADNLNSFFSQTKEAVLGTALAVGAPTLQVYEADSVVRIVKEGQ